MTTNRERAEKATRELADMAKSMSTSSLIDWLAQLAHDAEYDWGWIRRELLRRDADIIERAWEGEAGATLEQQIKTKIGVWRMTYQEQLDTGEYDAAAISESVVEEFESLLPARSFAVQGEAQQEFAVQNPNSYTCYRCGESRQLHSWDEKTRKYKCLNRAVQGEAGKEKEDAQ